MSNHGKARSTFNRSTTLIYIFQRVGQTTGPDKGGYYHELFLRGKHFLAEGIQRTKIKGMGPRKPAAGEIQPDFYALPPLEDSNINNNNNDTSSRPDEQSSAHPALISGLSGPASADSNVNLTSLLFTSLQVQQQQSQQEKQQQQQRFWDHLSTLARSACATSMAAHNNASSIPNGMASHILSQTLAELFERILAKDKMADGMSDPTSHAAGAQSLGRD